VPRKPDPRDLQSLLTELARGEVSSSISARFAAASKELYLVGGAVRDVLLGRPHGELDFATDATPEETRDLVRPLAEQIWTQGAKFGTIGARIAGTPVEITTFRTERYQPSSRHPEVSFAADIKTDLSRRDFTINAIAVRLPAVDIVDPFAGAEDLGRRYIRTPLDPIDSFGDDPLRMLRAFRFASQLGFEIDTDALRAIAELKDSLKFISMERVRDELSKLLVGDSPGRALELAESTGLTELFLPELSSLRLEQDPVHRHKDVFHHTLAVIERTPRDLVLRLGALFHDVGKPRTRRITPEGVSFHHHEVVGAEVAERRLRAMRFPNEVVEAVSEIIRLHHRFHTYRLGWTDSAVRRYVRDAGPLLGQLNDLVRADCTTRNRDKAERLARRMDELEERIAELAAREELSRIRPELDGKQVMAYLGVPPGPIVGQALDHLLEIRLDEGLLGEEEIYRRLDDWARGRGMDPPGQRVPKEPKK
jgi:poly(A) polymerase